MIIQPGEIPEEGLDLSGKIEKDIFELGDDEDARPAGPTTYDLHVMRADDFVLVHGQVEAPFRLRCVVCLEEFPFTSRMEHYAAEFDLESPDAIDLVERMREDLLLNLPPYPHCDEGDEDGRNCPMAGRISQAKDDTPEGPAPGTWDALDGLDTGSKTGD